MAVVVPVERAEPEVVDVAVFVDELPELDEADVLVDLVELLVPDVVVVVFVLSDDLATELRS